MNIQDYIGAESLPIIGNACPIRRGKKWLELAEIVKKKYPKLTEFIDSLETALILIEITQCIHVTRFQSVSECHTK
jgi:hypothetical protein